MTQSALKLPQFLFGIECGTKSYVTNESSPDLDSMLRNLNTQVIGNTLLLGANMLLGVDIVTRCISERTGIDFSTVQKSIVKNLNNSNSSTLLTGAETLSLMLKGGNFELAFAYPGTSELALCNTLWNVGIDVLNARGDSESVFLGAGSNIDGAPKAFSILHAARGLTNAAGAIGDVRRNEIGLLCLVGLPSNVSSSFFPPHAEVDLIKGVATFAKAGFEIGGEFSAESAKNFISSIRDAIHLSTSLPKGPVIVGIPQDALETRWIPSLLLSDSELTGLISKTVPIQYDQIEKVLDKIINSTSPVIIVDDFYYRRNDARDSLIDFAQEVGVPIVQVHYRRGPMLFEQLTSADTIYFKGMYEPLMSEHQELMQSSDLLITLEDRNMYPRVVGQLPSCSKVALTSNPLMTQKNAYLSDSDMLIHCNPAEYLRMITSKLRLRNSSKKYKKYFTGQTSNTSKRPPTSLFRSEFMKEFARAIFLTTNPIIFDDSQMFGGVIAENYELLPPKIKVFGDHGGFVGAGIAMASGYAISDPNSTVWCLVGDSGLLNGLKGVLSAIEHCANLIIVVCNNGGSVSLNKQLAKDLGFELNSLSYLSNIIGLDYFEMIRGFGIPSFNIEIGKSSVIIPNSHLDVLNKLITSSRPAFLQINVPASLEEWEGIWATTGIDEIRINQ